MLTRGDFVYSTEKLKEIRKDKGFTQKQIAEKLNITISFYSQLENKKKKLYYDTAIKIADIFNMRPDELFYTKNN